MNNHINRHSHDDESRLNPPPKTYRVSLGIKFCFLLVAMFGIAGYFYVLNRKRTAEKTFIAEKHIDANEPALGFIPKITVFDITTKTQTPLSKFQDSWILLNLWATWCPACQSEMPSLERLQKQFQKQLLVLAVSIDDDMESIIQWKSAHQPSFRIFWDQEKLLPQLFNLNKYPETFLIAPHGRLIKQFSGPRDWSSSTMIDYLLQTIKKDSDYAPN